VLIEYLHLYVKIRAEKTVAVACLHAVLLGSWQEGVGTVAEPGSKTCVVKFLSGGQYGMASTAQPSILSRHRENYRFRRERFGVQLYRITGKWNGRDKFERKR
jgi:hypothetical protein